MLYRYYGKERKHNTGDKKHRQQFVMTEAQKQVILDAKKRVETVIEFIQKLEKIQGSNKQ